MTTDKVCELCSQQAAKYQCPKCQVKYCSLSCYKLSSSGNSPARTLHKKCLKAVESSNEREFKELLKTVNNQSNKDDIEKVQKILLDNNRATSQSSDDSMPFLASPRFNHNADNNGVEVEFDGSDVDSIASDEFREIVEKMSPDEIEKFNKFCEKFAASSSIEKSKDELFDKVRQLGDPAPSNSDLKMKLWEPWWNTDNFSFGLVQDLSEKDIETSPIIHVKPMKSGRITNPRIVYHIVDLLLAYVCSCRVLNGEAEGLVDMLDTFSYIISTSVDLSVKTSSQKKQPSASPAASFVYENAHEAVQIFKSRLIGSGYNQSSDAILVLLDDITRILQKQQHTQAAFSDMIRAFDEIEGNRFLSRKCAFFLSLFNGLDAGVVDDILQEIQIEAERERSELLVLKSPPISKPLIHEL